MSLSSLNVPLGSVAPAAMLKWTLVSCEVARAGRVVRQASAATARADFMSSTLRERVLRRVGYQIHAKRVGVLRGWLAGNKISLYTRIFIDLTSALNYPSIVG